jgi:hypothetical protein
MGAGRRAGVAAVALVAAVVPGALRLLPTTPAVERAGVVQVGGLRPLPASPAVGPGVPITPPGELVGEPAPVTEAPTTFVPVAATGPEVFALVIGIDDYPGTSADLRQAVADADLVDAALDGFGVPDGHRVVLRDGQARRAEVEAAVRALAVQGGPGSTLVLAYAGHTRKLGPEREAMVLADGGTLTDLELASLLAPATSQRMWLLLATCFAGGFTELLGPGRILTGAADARSLAYESPALGASYLVHHMVREGWLQGQAGPTVQAAFRHADQRLAVAHPRRRPIQVDVDGAPLVLGDGDPHRAAAPSGTPGPAPPPGPSASEAPPSTAPPARPEESCLLGLLCSG